MTRKRDDRNARRPYYVSRIQVRPRTLIAYPFNIVPCSAANHSPNLFTPETKPDNKTKGTLSEHSQRKLRKAITWLTASALPKKYFSDKDEKYFTFRLNFITLTLAAPVTSYSDMEIKRLLLNSFLQDLKRDFGLQSYVWKAEVQDNGNLHFHITTDCYIHWQDIRKYWNHVLRKAGFIDLYREIQEKWHKHGFNPRPELFSAYSTTKKKHVARWPLCKQYAAYQRGKAEKWSNPNSTDVHSVKRIRDLAAYLIDYMCKKEEGKRPIEGKIWGCSKNLQNIKAPAYEEGTDTWMQLEQCFLSSPKKVIEKGKIAILPLNEYAFEMATQGKIGEDYQHTLALIRQGYGNTNTPDRTTVEKREKRRTKFDYIPPSNDCPF